jgi:membrane protein DedA with SNARE-associated domain
MHEWFQAAMTLGASGGGLLLVALAIGTFLSEDLACVAAGLLVAQGSLHFAAAAAACFAGILAGDLMLAVIGRTVGRRSLAAIPVRWFVTPEAVDRAERWFSRRGPSLVLVSRFMPGTRLPTYVAAGVLRAPLLPFFGWFVLAGLIWTPLLVGGAAILGDVALEVFGRWTNLVPVLIAAGAACWILSRLAAALSTWRGRRLLLGKWRRLTRWEFWPMWAVYPPVVAYVLWLGLRYRSVTLPTAVNPGIGNGGGLVGESKSEILRGLAGAGDVVARWCPVRPGEFRERVEAVREFMRREQLTFPIVLKPDVGERGKGVEIVRDEAALERAIRANARPLIAQAHVPGVEYGVFYFRRPDGAQGEILAITDKRFVAVTGDGERTLEELILGDERAVCMAPYFLRTHADRLGEVPDAGERVALSELGTHCRGALFLDGTKLLTPALAAAIEQTSRAFRGFHFGRYDVRAESSEAFQRGEFKVIELNGLTS